MAQPSQQPGSLCRTCTRILPFDCGMTSHACTPEHCCAVAAACGCEGHKGQPPARQGPLSYSCTQPLLGAGCAMFHAAACLSAAVQLVRHAVAGAGLPHQQEHMGLQQHSLPGSYVTESHGKRKHVCCLWTNSAAAHGAAGPAAWCAAACVCDTAAPPQVAVPSCGARGMVRRAAMSWLAHIGGCWWGTKHCQAWRGKLRLVPACHMPVPSSEPEDCLSAMKAGRFMAGSWQR